MTTPIPPNPSVSAPGHGGHTPGPWSFDPDSGHINSDTAIPGGCQMLPGRVFIAEVRGWGHLQYRPDGEAMQEANGYVLAAAPDLLAACEAMLEWLDAIAGGRAILADLADAIEIAKEAVAKAKGMG